MEDEAITTQPKRVTHEVFLNEVAPTCTHIRVGVVGVSPPFDYVYFKTSKREVMEYVRVNEAFVTYSIMYNSKIHPELEDVIYVTRIEMTILDKIKKEKE